GGATADLPFQQHGIDYRAAVVSDDVFIDLDAPGLEVDLDDRSMRCVRPGDGLRLEMEGLLEARLHTLRAAVVPAGTRSFGDLGERHHSRGPANDADTAVPKFQVRRRTFQQMCRDG